jgi:hypothetical protein
VDPLFLTLAEAIELHADQIHRYGGQAGLRDLALIASPPSPNQRRLLQASGCMENTMQWPLPTPITCAKITRLSEATNEPRLLPHWFFSN